MHFGISEGKGGLKYGSRPSLCTDIFWNCPLLPTLQVKIILVTMATKMLELVTKLEHWN